MTTLAGLPRSEVLTNLVLSPAENRLDDDVVASVRRRLLGVLERTTPGNAGLRRIDPYFLRTALTTPQRLVDPEPFRWSPLTVRRRLGIAAVRRCVEGQCSTPSAAVTMAWDELASGADRGGVAAWLGHLRGGGRAAVYAEAVTWATNLWCALDWGRFPSPPRLGPPDRWWRDGRTSSIALRARVDVAGWTPSGDGAGSAPALLSVLGGHPSSSSRAELGLASLVAILSNPSGPVPTRSVGLWPDCGRAIAVTTDRASLERTVDAIGRALSAVATVDPLPAPVALAQAA